MEDDQPVTLKSRASRGLPRINLFMIEKIKTIREREELVKNQASLLDLMLIDLSQLSFSKPPNINNQKTNSSYKYFAVWEEKTNTHM